MSSVLNAIGEDRQILLDLFPHIEESVWATESGCPGWSVQDLVSHMACSFWLAVDPSRLPDPAGLPAERAADLYVESRRSMTVDEVVADYESVSRKGIELLAGLDGQDEVEIPLGDVGTYPASFVPNAFAFEAYIHLRFDLFGPNGPLAGEPPATDELRLAPTLDWIEAYTSTGSALALCESATPTLLPTSPWSRKHSYGGSPNAVPGKSWALTPKGMRRPWASCANCVCSDCAVGGSASAARRIETRSVMLS